MPNDLRKVLEAVLTRNATGQYAAREITKESGQNRVFVYRVLDLLRDMKFVARHKSGYQFKVFENTSLIPDEIEVLMMLYENWHVARRLKIH